MTLRFGPAGIPLSCKGRTLKDGIEDVHNLGLNAMEVQLIRAVGTPMDNLGEIKDLAKDLDVQLTVHTPYYMELSGTGPGLETSVQNMKWAGMIAHEMGAKIVNTHLGLYVHNNKKQSMENVVSSVRKVRDWYKKNKLKPLIGLEASGKQKVFGSLEDILTVTKRIGGTIPVLNFAHIHARERGSLKKKEAFQAVFDQTHAITKDKFFYCHFSGVEHEDGDKRRNTPIKKGDMRFDPLADCLLDNPKYDITVISGSPLLEHDALYMKVILERVVQKREAKAARENAEGKNGKVGKNGKK